jgi:hypothetical protein
MYLNEHSRRFFVYKKYEHKPRVFIVLYILKKENFN